MPRSAVNKSLVISDMLLPDPVVRVDSFDSSWIKAASLTEYVWRLLVATVEQLKETARVRPRAMILKSTNYMISNLLGFLDPGQVSLGFNLLLFPPIVHKMKSTCHIDDVSRARIRDK